MPLRIDESLLEKIRKEGRLAYPHECCGLLLGRVEDGRKMVASLRPIPNSREDSPSNRYLISPKDLFAAEKEARNLGVDIIGVYHSHPDHPARPSEFDREHAFPWYSYIVLRVEKGESRELTSWTLREDRSAFDSEAINPN